MLSEAPSGPAELVRLRALTGVKWARYGADVLPAWVADMDYEPPAAVRRAIGSLVDAGDLGYNTIADQLAPAYAEFQERHHGWRPDVELVRPFTTVLHAIETVLWYTTSPGDGVVVFTPIYHPFLAAIDGCDRRRVEVELQREGWRLDPARLEAAIDDTTRVVLFCQPHNPTGRVFDAEELSAIADVAERHDLLVISDEIWGDLTYDVPHRPLATADARFGGRLITLGSASKTFNLAGLRCAVAHLDHQATRDVLAALPTHLFGNSSSLGIAATIAAWRECDRWMATVVDELAERRRQLVRRVRADLPGIRLDPPEATYLSWLDFSATRFADEPAEGVLRDAAVALSEGSRFGAPGHGFARLNFATTESILDEILDRIAAALAAH